MADPKLLEFTVQTFTADKLELKVKNIGGKALEDTLAIELFIPAYLVNSKVNDAAKKAATNLKPIGVASLAGVVTGPDSWSVWAKRETSDSSVVILLLNDLTQSGTELATPIKLAAGAEFIIGVPLNPQANRAAVNVLYSYQHGTGDERGDGKLELKADTKEEVPNVTLFTTEKNPTAIPPANIVKVFWKIENGVSATLRGPLPGGNSELSLSSDPTADFKIADGFIEIRVVSAMTYILQAEVKRNGKPNIEVVRMLFLDTINNKYTYLSPRPTRVLPYGLIEIDWAAWGVKQVEISVSGHTTRTIPLTQQTLGRFYEGSGIMRVNATRMINGVKTLSEAITLQAPPEKSRTRTVDVISWIRMEKAGIDGPAVGLAVISPKIGVLTSLGLYIAEVGELDPSPPLEKLEFSRRTQDVNSGMWFALTAVDQRFVGLLLIFRANPIIELRPFNADGSPDEIPPVTLPEDLAPLAFSHRAVFDLVGFGGRAYLVVETPAPFGSARRAYSVGFNSQTKKADLRPEPLLDHLNGYRLVTFDDALYAINRASGRMLRFDLTKTGTLEEPKKAASAVKKGEGGGAKEQSMIGDGLLVPVGRLLVVVSPASVPPVDSLEQFGLQNTLRYTSSSSTAANIPQDLIYNPQKDYWGRCGHDLDVKSGAVVAFRSGESKRLWVIEENDQVHTLAVGSESLFAPDYVFEFPTKSLPPYFNKKRQFKITNSTGLQLLPLSENLHKGGLTEFSASGPTELISELPGNFRSGSTETFEFRYHDADPVPVTLRFQVNTASGVAHKYLLEVNFSGPDLATATSVFKRVIVGERSALSIAEIPGTALQHATNNPIVISPPKRLIEGVSLRARNNTTYEIWHESPQARDRFEVSNTYRGGEIKITYDTPPFYFLAYGAGELHVNVDFALPPGIEVSAGSQQQRQLLRINTDKSVGLHVEIDPTTSQTQFDCKLSYLRKQELTAAYIGDGVATERGEWIYLPVALDGGQGWTQVWKINPEDLSATKSVDFVSNDNRFVNNVFATPNSIALSNEYVFAIFADNNVRVLDFSLQLDDTVSLNDAYSVITAVKCQYDSEYFVLGMKQEGANARYKLGSKFIAKSRSGPRKTMTDNIREISLDAVKGFREQNRVPGSPAWVSSKTISPMAASTSIVSPGGERVREVAVCIDGGLFVVGSSDKTIRTLALESAFREEDIVFGREGKHIYCLHSESDNMGLRVSRVDNKTWKQTHTLALQTGQKAPDLTTDTRQQRPGINKNQRAISMVRTLDDKLIFVSHGRSIFKIDAATMKLMDTYKTELPCRVFHVWAGKPTQDSHPAYGSPSSCILLYAIGATYKGDGFRGTEIKTHLYKLGIPDR